MKGWWNLSETQRWGLQAEGTAHANVGGVA